MSTAGPFGTYFGLIQRSPHYIEMFCRDKPEIAGYQFWTERTINNVYGNPLASGVGGTGAQAMFQVTAGQHFRSAALRRKGLGLYESNRRGQTTVVFDVDDFITPAPSPVPPDEDVLYLRVQENRRTSGLLTVPGPLPVLGPIYVVPPPKFFGQMSPVLAVQGTAPSGTGSAAGSPPNFDQDLTSAGPRPMYLVFPVPLSAVTIRNLAAAGGNDLLVCFDDGQPMVEIPPASDLSPDTVGRVKSVILACPDAGGVAFSIHGAVDHG